MTIKSICQSGRLGMGGIPARPKMPPCCEEAEPGHLYCAQHLEDARRRAPDRAIGDRRALKWGRNYS